MYTVRDIQGNVILTIEKDSIFAVFKDVDLRNADFKDAKLRYAKFIHCNVDGADFRGADMLAGCIIHTDFKKATTDNTTKFPVPHNKKPCWM